MGGYLLFVALSMLAAAPAGAQQRAGGGLRLAVPAPPPLFDINSGFPGVIVVERAMPPFDDAQDERAKKETPPPSAAVPLPAPSAQGGAKERKPYVVGSSYASLPGGCMKLIEEGVSFYYCSGEWYRQVGDGRSVSYKAVARRL